MLTASDGLRGMALFHRKQPEMVITDIVMPRQGGIETILMLRRSGAPVKIIAMSDHGGEMLETALLVGADDVMEKPFLLAALANRVRSLSDAATAPT